MTLLRDGLIEDPGMALTDRAFGRRGYPQGYPPGGWVREVKKERVSRHDE
jgi:hypothetical protein